MPSSSCCFLLLHAASNSRKKAVVGLIDISAITLATRCERCQKFLWVWNSVEKETMGKWGVREWVREMWSTKPVIVWLFPRGSKENFTALSRCDYEPWPLLWSHLIFCKDFSHSLIVTLHGANALLTLFLHVVKTSEHPWYLKLLDVDSILSGI